MFYRYFIFRICKECKCKETIGDITPHSMNYMHLVFMNDISMPYLLVKDDIGQEYEDALQQIKCSEEILEGEHAVVDRDEGEHPDEPQEGQQHDARAHPVSQHGEVRISLLGPAACM